MSYVNMDQAGTGDSTFEIGGTAESWGSAGGTPDLELDVALVSASSTTEIPVGAHIKEVIFDVTTGYDNSATLPCIVDGTSDLALATLPAEQAAVAGTYKYATGWEVAAGETGPLNVAPTGSPTAGACKVYLVYSKTTVA